MVHQEKNHERYDYAAAYKHSIVFVFFFLLSAAAEEVATLNADIGEVACSGHGQNQACSIPYVLRSKKTIPLKVVGDYGFATVLKGVSHFDKESTNENILYSAKLI